MEKITGYIIGNGGDSETGIQPARFELKGDIFFENEKDKKFFENCLIAAFEVVCDPVRVITFEDNEIQQKRFEAYS
jgi:hypothetical protein